MSEIQYRNMKHSTPAFRTFSGEASLQNLPRELERVGAERAVIICGKSILKHGTAMSRIYNSLGDRLVGQFSGTVEHSQLPAVEAASEYLAECRADAIIAVGGGSAVVTSRAASILFAEQKGIRQLCTRQDSGGKFISPRLLAPKIPQWIVPSTPSTAYAKAGSAVRDPETGDRLALYDPKTRAQGVFLNPVVASTAPQGLVWSAALSAFATAVENLMSAASDPLAYALSGYALRMIVQSLPQLQNVPQNTNARIDLMLAALMSGQGSDYSGGGLAQALSHAIGPRSSMANGVAEAMLLPHSIRFNYASASDQMPALADALGVDGRTPASVVAEIERILELFQVPKSLSGIGVAHTDLDQIAEHASKDWAIAYSQNAPARPELLGILERAL